MSANRKHDQSKLKEKKVDLDQVLMNIDKMSDEITAAFGYNKGGEPPGKIQTIQSDFTGFENLEGEQLVHKVDLLMDPKSVEERVGKMKQDLLAGLYTEDQLSKFYEVRQEEHKKEVEHKKLSKRMASVKSISVSASSQKEKKSVTLDSEKQEESKAKTEEPELELPSKYWRDEKYDMF